MLVPIKIMVEQLRGMRHRSRKHKSKSHIAPEGCLPHHHPPTSVSSAPVKVVDCDDDDEQRSPWVHLPPELLLDIINRVESAEKSWPARRDVVACAAVCRSWRDMVSEIVKTPQECGLLTFPISLKQPGPRELPIQCFIRRDRSCSTYRLYLGLSPALSGEESKIILTAKKIRRATCLDFIISLVPNDFSRATSNYVGKLRSNFLGTKFTVFDSQPPLITTLLPPSKRTHQRVHSRKMSPTVTPGSYPVASIQYELNVLRTRGPRRMNCMMHSIPMASLHEGGTAPTPTAFTRGTGNCHPAQLSSAPTSSSENSLSINNSSESQLEGSEPVNASQDPLVIKNKAPRWHEQLQCWCLNFKGRVTVASVKNFQLVASAGSDHDISVVEQEKVILQFGKIGKDIFTMDYRYPLSAFQAFAICLSSFDTKPACE